VVDINSIGLDHKQVAVAAVLALPVVMYLQAHHLQIVYRVRVAQEYHLVPEKTLTSLQVVAVVHSELAVPADLLAAVEPEEIQAQMVVPQRRILVLAAVELVLHQMVVQVVQD
jgi:hypothetical protein